MIRISLLLTLLLILLPVHVLASDWTILVYMVPDEKVESALVQNVKDMARVGSTDQVNVLVQFDRAGGQATRYHIQRGGEEPIENLGEVNMGDPQTLYDFITWGLKRCPARRVALIINSHGSGWESYSGPGSTSSGQPGSDGDIRQLLPAGVNLNDFQQAIAYDDDPKDCLTLIEIRRVLAKIRQHRGNEPIDLLNADACLFSMLESLAEMQDVVKVVEASASTIPASGMFYKGFISALQKDPKMDGEKLADIIAEGFIRNSRGDNILSAFRTADAGGILDSLDQLVRRIGESGQRPGIQNLITYGGSDKYWDLKRLAESIQAGKTTLTQADNWSEIKQAASRLLSALSTARVTTWYSGSFAERKAGGLAVYWPEADRYRKLRPYYKTLRMSREHLWDEFVDFHTLKQPLDLPAADPVSRLESIYRQPRRDASRLQGQQFLMDELLRLNQQGKRPDVDAILRQLGQSRLPGNVRKELLQDATRQLNLQNPRGK